MKHSKLLNFTVVFAILLLCIIAVGAGMFLAMWDTGSSVSEVYSMAFPGVKIVEGETKVITSSKGDIKEEIKEDEVLHSGKDTVTDSEEITPITNEISGGINPSVETDSTVSPGNSSIEAGAGLIPETDEPETEKTEEPEEKKPEKKPLKITSEISGIESVVRAADEDSEVVNELPAPAQIIAETVECDPLADYPLPYTEVDTSYFDDALFIGDSRVAGLAMNSGTNATFYAVTSFQVFRYKTFNVVQTPGGKVPIFDAMPYDKFTKIYIKVGLNELGTVTDEPFLNAYTELINDLRVMQPRAIIYIQAVLPVTQVKSQTDRVHCNEKITARNENLKIFAEAMKCYYVDVGPYFADETGALRAETTADGIHMYGKYMPQWIDALRKNAVEWPPKAQ